jgi:hypothetical protein
MTEFNDPHTPSPEFRAALKQELRRAYRAERQFGVPPSMRVRRLGMVIGIAAGAVMMLTIGLILGAATGYASAEGVSERQREVVTVAANTEGTIRQYAAMRLDLARANYEAVRRDVEAGRSTRAELQTAQAEVDSMKANLARVDVELKRGGVPVPESSDLSRLTGHLRNALASLTCAATTVVAQTPPPAAAPRQPGIPVVTVSPVVAKSTSTLGAVLGVRELSDGRLLVNDGGRRQIKIFDASLANATIAQDSSDGMSNSYGPRPAQIVPYLGDSTLFTEIVTRDVLVLDRNGQVARALATPMYQPPDLPREFPFPMPGAVDNKGRLLAETGFTVRAGGMVADSTLVVRADLDTRKVDVVGTRHASRGQRNRQDPPENGNRVVTSIVQPIDVEDSWAVLSDGTIAFVRGQDYHVDWVHPDGTKSATTKLPFDWKRLSDADKQRIVDSARVVMDSLTAIRNKRVAAAATGGRGGEPGMPATGGAGQRSGGGAAAPGQQGSIQRIEFVPLSEIPDYYPPIRRTSAMADLDGNLWILPTTSAQSKQGELVYDVVNPKQGLFRRVRMPLGRSIAGFGKNGVIYLQAGDRTNGFTLERVKLDRASLGTTPDVDRVLNDVQSKLEGIKSKLPPR